MALFLFVLLSGGVYVRMTHGRTLPRITQQWDSKLRRQVTKGRFDVALYKLSPRLWRAWAVMLDVGAAAALIAGIVVCFRMSTRG